MKNKTYTLVLSGVLAAIVLVLGMTPIGLIPLGFINVTIICIPVIIGALAAGLKTGILLGAVFGIASTLSAFGLTLASQSSLAAMLLGVNPMYVIIMSVMPRLLVPIVAYGVYMVITKRCTVRLKRGTAIAAVCASLTNTIGYLGLMLLFFVMAGLDSSTILGLIFGTGAIAGTAEAVVAGIICTPVVTALKRRKV